jgi:hypothetical protein
MNVNRERREQLPALLSKGMMVFRSFYRPDSRPGKSGDVYHGSELCYVIKVDQGSDTATLGRIYTITPNYGRYDGKPDYHNTIIEVPLNGGGANFDGNDCLVTGPVSIDDESWGQVAEQLLNDQSRRVGDWAGEYLLGLFTRLEEEGKISSEGLSRFIKALDRVRAGGFTTEIDKLREMRREDPKKRIGGGK